MEEPPPRGRRERVTVTLWRELGGADLPAMVTWPMRVLVPVPAGVGVSVAVSVGVGVKVSVGVVVGIEAGVWVAVGVPVPSGGAPHRLKFSFRRLKSCTVMALSPVKSARSSYP